MSHFLAVEHQPARLHKPTFLLVIVLPQEVPQEKTVVPNLCLGRSESPAGLCLSCELSTHHLLALLPRCSHQASRLSQRLRESLGASCDHCHKNRVPWTGCHCCLLSVKGASYVPGPLVSLTVMVSSSVSLTAGTYC